MRTVIFSLIFVAATCSAASITIDIPAVTDSNHVNMLVSTAGLSQTIITPGDVIFTVDIVPTLAPPNFAATGLLHLTSNGLGWIMYIEARPTLSSIEVISDSYWSQGGYPVADNTWANGAAILVLTATTLDDLTTAGTKTIDLHVELRETPEPAPLALVGISGLLLLASRWRRGLRSPL